MKDGNCYLVVSSIMSTDFTTVENISRETADLLANKFLAVGCSYIACYRDSGSDIEDETVFTIKPTKTEV